MKKLIICEKSSLAKGVISGINTMNYGDKMKTIEYYKGKDALSSLYYYENNKNIKADEPKLVVICLLLQAKERNLFIKTKKRMKKVRAAIVGYGNIGHYVLEALQEIGRAHV